MARKQEAAVTFFNMGPKIFRQGIGLGRDYVRHMFSRVRNIGPFCIGVAAGGWMTNQEPIPVQAQDRNWTLSMPTHSTVSGLLDFWSVLAMLSS